MTMTEKPSKTEIIKEALIKAGQENPNQIINLAEFAREAGGARQLGFHVYHQLKDQGVSLPPTKKGKLSDPTVTIRNDQVASLWGENLTAPEIAAQLAIPLTTVRYSIGRLSKDGSIQPHKLIGLQREEVGEQVVILYQEGETCRGIQEELKLTRGQVGHFLREARNNNSITPRRPKRD